MSRWTKLIASMRASKANVRFEDLTALVRHIGYTHDRTSGSHMIFVCTGRPMINLQPGKDGKAKPPQVREVLDIIEEHEIEG